MALSAGCGLVGTDDPGPADPSSGASADSTSSEGTTPSDEVVSVERTWHDAQVRFDVHPVEVDGGTALLRYDFTVTSLAEEPTPFLFSQVQLALGGLGNTVTDGRGVRLFDTGAGQVYPVAVAPGGDPAAVLEPVGGTEADGSGQGTATAAFAAPENDTVDVLFPVFGLVTVPVVAAGDTFADALDQVGGVEEAGTKKLRAFTHAYDEESATSAEGDAMTVTLASDVLFDSDEHTLSNTARGVVDRAAESIRKQADGGEVRVVGHTDDVDTDAYNQALSERRARSVAERLGSELGSDFTLSQEGRGESEPIAEGTGEEARAANRRVEIEFEGHLVVEAEQEDDAPETEAPTAENDTVTVTTEGGDYAIRVDSLVRRPDAIIGTLVAERTRGDGIQTSWFLPSYLTQVGDRNFGVLADLTGPHNLSLLGAQERVLPYDYVQQKVSGDFVLRRLLADEELEPLDTGEATLITVVWPDTGQDTVTIDAPDRFRITDVPVTDTPVTDAPTED